MIVRTLDELRDAGRIVSEYGWTSRRLLLQGDGMGFSLHDTEIEAGAELSMHYRHHLEAVYVIEGRGKVVALDSDAEYELGPGTVYALNNHDRHVLIAETNLRTVCVFKPPLVGPESHDETGAYPLLTSRTPFDPLA
jgi:L-ectoine synthase